MRLDRTKRASGAPGSTTMALARWFHNGRQASATASGQHYRSALQRLLTLVCASTMLLGFALASLMLLAPYAQAKGGVGGGAVPGAIPLSVGAATLPGQPTPFDIVGAIQSFTNTPTGKYSGTIVVNGITVQIPQHLVVTLPAAYKTVGQLFLESPVARQSGLALLDLPAPIAAYEATIAGNIVGGVYTAGLVSIAQQSLNTANGYIRSIIYSTGDLCVGSTPVGAVSGATACALTDTRVVINDPLGRYGLANGTANGTSKKASPDKRFSVDADNPTIHARSGYPMCVPRFTPPVNDPTCPMANRPSGSTLYVMASLPMTAPAQFVGLVIPACPSCNAKEQAPLVVGDYITYSGILSNDNDTRGTYVAAYALEANVGIYTPSGGTPFYMYMDAPLISTGPAACPANAECQARLKTSIFMTDPFRTPALYAVDEDRLGARTSRPLPSTITNTGVLGRFVIVVNKDVGVLGLNVGGVTREIMGRAIGVGAGASVFYGPLPAGAPAAGTANGLVAGQYVSPVGSYIFPEPNIAGGILTPYNFRCLAFLAQGWGGDLPGGVGPLNPFPEAGGVAPGSVNCAF